MRSRRARGCKNTRFASFTAELNSMDGKRLSHRGCELAVRAGEWSPDTIGNAHVSKADIDVDAGGQYVVLRYDSDGSEVVTCVDGRAQERGDSPSVRKRR